MLLTERITTSTFDPITLVAEWINPKVSAMQICLAVNIIMLRETVYGSTVLLKSKKNHINPNL